MSYQYITAHDAKCFTRGRQGRTIKKIVIHHWDDPENHPSFDGVVSWFVSGRGNNSAHYVVEEGRVACLVAESDTAWHAGNWVQNLESIGIECNPRCSEGDKRTVAELIQNIRARYGNLPLVGHKDIVATGCPGRYYPPNQVLAPYLGGTASQVQPQKEASSSASGFAPNIQALAEAVIRGEYGNGDERKRRLGASYSAVQARVNEILSGSKQSAPAPNIDALADAVIRGEYGNGEERKRRLGALYGAVQKRVNEKLL